VIILFGRIAWALIRPRPPVRPHPPVKSNHRIEPTIAKDRL
jgi:hypothetical protein